MRVQQPSDFAGWRQLARGLLAAAVPPERVVWQDDDGAQQGLFATVSAAGPQVSTGKGAPMGNGAPAASVPKAFLTFAQLASFYRDAARWALLYRLLHRLTHGEPHLLAIASDDDVLRLQAMVRAVRRDRHKMHAFVRLHLTETPEGPRYLAWHRPDHLIVRLAAPFFQRRFASMRWSIFTPDESAHWDGEALTYGAGVARQQAPVAEDDYAELFRDYYRAIFNPARLNLRAMQKEMPRKHWATLPEAQTLPALIRQAPERSRTMQHESFAPRRRGKLRQG